MSDYQKFLDFAWGDLEYAKVPISGRMRMANSCYMAHNSEIIVQWVDDCLRNNDAI